MRASVGAICVTLAWLFAIVGPLLAGPLTFAIDSEQSHVSFTLETVDGVPFSSPQTPGSGTTSLLGTANVDVSGGSIQFLSTGDTQFALQAVDQSPLPFGALGTAPAQFGLNVALEGIGSGVVAARDYLGDATSGPIPLVGDSFDASQVTLDLVVGNTDYNLTVFETTVMGRVDTNFPALNMLSNGTLTLAGDVYTLTLPMLVSGTITVSGVTVVNVYSGQLVATAVAPEPSSFVLAVLGIFGVAVCRLGGGLAINRRRR